MERKKNIMSSDELVRQLTELGGMESNLFFLSSQVGYRIEELFDDEVRKLPRSGECLNGHNREDFLKEVSSICKARGVSYWSDEYDEHVSLHVDGEYPFYMDVYVDKIYFWYGWRRSVFFDSMGARDLAHMVADEDGAIYRLHVLQRRLEESVKYYTGDMLKAMYDEKSIQAALSDESAFDRIRSEYAAMYAEMQPFEVYEHILTWEEALREKGIDTALRMLADIDRFTEGKSPESAARYRKRYENSQNVLAGARKRGMLTDDEARRIVTWDEYITPKVSGYSEEALADGYLASVEKAYQDTLAVCDARGTDYMAKKKKKLLADRELCSRVKEKLGRFCFIDKSTHSQRVCHLNVVINGNEALVFRIPKQTPELGQLENMAALAGIIEDISRTLGKTVRLTSCRTACNMQKLNVSAPKELKAFASGLSPKLKMLKGGRLTVASANVTLGVPVCGLEWCISLRRKEAAEKIDSIAGPLTDYMKVLRAMEDWPVKGIYPNRMPNI